MKKSHLIALIIVILALIAGGLVWWGWERNQENDAVNDNTATANTNVTNTNTTATEPTEDLFAGITMDTSKWIRHDSTTANFSFLAPPEMVVQDRFIATSTSLIDEVISDYPQDYLRFEVVIDFASTKDNIIFDVQEQSSPDQDQQKVSQLKQTILASIQTTGVIIPDVERLLVEYRKKKVDTSDWQRHEVNGLDATLLLPKGWSIVQHLSNIDGQYVVDTKDASIVDEHHYVRISLGWYEGGYGGLNVFLPLIIDPAGKPFSYHQYELSNPPGKPSILRAISTFRDNGVWFVAGYSVDANLKTYETIISSAQPL